MTGPEHYREAERLVAHWHDNEDLPPGILSAAQVHATLALAAAEFGLDDSDNWPVTP